MGGSLSDCQHEYLVLVKATHIRWFFHIFLGLITQEFSYLKFYVFHEIIIIIIILEKCVFLRFNTEHRATPTFMIMNLRF